MKKKPLKLRPLNNELSQSEEAGRLISESLMSRVATAGTMKGVWVWVLLCNLNTQLLTHQTGLSRRRGATGREGALMFEQSLSIYSVLLNILSSPGPKPQSPKPKTKGPWADSKILWATCFLNVHILYLWVKCDTFKFNCCKSQKNWNNKTERKYI